MGVLLFVGANSKKKSPLASGDEMSLIVMGAVKADEMADSWGYNNRLVADRGWCYSMMQRRFGVGARMVRRCRGEGTCVAVGIQVAFGLLGVSWTGLLGLVVSHEVRPLARPVGLGQEGPKPRNYKKRKIQVQK